MLGEKAREIAALATKCDELDGRAHRLSRDAAEASARQEQQIAELLETVDQKNQVIAALESKCDEMDGRMHRISRDAADASSRQEQQIADLLETMDQKNRELEAQRQAFEGVSAEFDVARRESEERARRLLVVEGRLAEAENKIREQDDRAAHSTSRFEASLSERDARIHTLESSLAKAAEEKARAVQLAQMVQRLQAELRERQDGESRQARELEAIVGRHKQELERKEQQRQQEISKLRESVQEKAKALRVVELELERYKSRLLQGGGSSVAPRPSSSSPRAVSVAPTHSPVAAPASPRVTSRVPTNRLSSSRVESQPPADPFAKAPSAQDEVVDASESATVIASLPQLMSQGGRGSDPLRGGEDDWSDVLGNLDDLGK